MASGAATVGADADEAADGAGVGEVRTAGGALTRDLEPEPGALPGLGVEEAQGAAVQLGHPAGHGEAEAGPPGAVGAEALEDALAVLRRHSPAGVDDLEPPRAAVGPVGPASAPA